MPVSRAPRALQNLDQLLRDLMHGIERAPLRERVDVGFVLQTMGTQAKKASDKVKATLRLDAAPKFSPGVPTISLEGDEAFAVVSAPEPLVRITKGANLEPLRRALGDEFRDYFDEQVIITPRKDALNRVMSLPADVRDLYFSVVEQDEGAGGVSFNRRKS